MINIEDFGVCNFRLAVKVMSTGKCQCKPKEKCPCPEWIANMECRCGVFWNLKEKEGNMSKNEIKIVSNLVIKLTELIRSSKSKLSSGGKEIGLQKP